MGKKTQNIDLNEQRYGLFMTDNSFDLEIMYGRAYLKSDSVHYITLYKVNTIETKAHKLYGQAKSKDKVFMTPVKLNIMLLNIEEAQQSYYGNTQGGITRDDTGNLIFGVYLKELDELNIDIDRGDYIEYNLSGEKNRYYEVEYANKVTDIGNRTIAGYKPFYKKIIAIPVKEDTIPFL